MFDFVGLDSGLVTVIAEIVSGRFYDGCEESEGARDGEK